MGKAQVFNPYLPSYEYIPDGEPHVFGERLYIFGSHDRYNGGEYCMNDYVCWSANVMDLTDWKYEGVIYKKMQDPRNSNPELASAYVLPQWALERQRQADLAGATERNPENVHAMWAPDVGRGPDGRYYLYYCLDYYPEIAVAVCEEPAGKYEFLGFVKYSDGVPLGHKPGDIPQFDPAVYVDKGHIYLYSGNGPINEEEKIGQLTGPLVMELKEDMLTLANEPKRFLPTASDSRGTGFAGHEFFEGSSMRKWGDTYYFIYSSVLNAELCYAKSKFPDYGFTYGGTAVHIADVGLKGRSYRQGVNMTGNTHGSIEKINGNYYVFYHRQTNRTDYSRQGCAEKIFMDDNGDFAQAEVTSCGLNDGDLTGWGIYPACICCHLRGEKGITCSGYAEMGEDYPYLKQEISDVEPEAFEAKKDSEEPIQFITNIGNQCSIGYKYFTFEDRVETVELEFRGDAAGVISLYTDLSRNPIGRGRIALQQRGWERVSLTCVLEGKHVPFYIFFEGTGKMDFRRLAFGEKIPQSSREVEK